MILSCAGLLAQTQVKPPYHSLCEYDSMVEKGADDREKKAREDHYLALLGVVQELADHRAKFLATGDLIELFPTAYYHTTLSEMFNIVNNDFTYPIEKMQQMLAFYDAYKINRMGWDTGNKLVVEEHWKDHFEEASKYHRTKESFPCWGLATTLEKGIRAHVEYDLLRALKYAYKNRYHKQLSWSDLTNEFTVTNSIFSNTNTKTKEDVAIGRGCSKKSQDRGEEWLGWWFLTDKDVINMRMKAWELAQKNAPSKGKDGKPLIGQPISHHSYLRQIGKNACGPNGPEDISLFLFDVSGSMGENNKIGEARSSALSTLTTLKQQKEGGLVNPVVSIFAFSGGCSPSSTRKILDFTEDLDHALLQVQNRIPRPSGRTPLPQAIGVAETELNDYLTKAPKGSAGKVILLSDGKSTCGDIRPANVFQTPVGNPQSLASTRASNTKVPLTYYTVGLGLKPGSPAERDLQYLSASSGGMYLNAQDGVQLTRAFQKFHRKFEPIPHPDIEASYEHKSLFIEGRNAILSGHISHAIKLFSSYTDVSPQDRAGTYNLGLMYEANGQYDLAANWYRKSSALSQYPKEKRRLDSLALKMDQDFEAYRHYQLKILYSDFEYLKNYYQDLFVKRNDLLAQEFQGFILEKRSFYHHLPNYLNNQDPNFAARLKSLVSSLDKVAAQLGSPNFDRDAISLLADPLAQFEQLIIDLESRK